jgi:outer membrane protein assembly factor BamB
VENYNYGLSENFKACVLKEICLKYEIKIPTTDFWSNPSMDSKHIYVTTGIVYDSKEEKRNSGFVVKICRHSFKVEEAVKIDCLTGKYGDACHYTPVLRGPYVYLASSVEGKEGSVLCIRKKCLSKVVWIKKLTGKTTGCIGLNPIIVNLQALPEAGKLGPIRFRHSQNKRVIKHRRRLACKVKHVLYVATKERDGKVYALDAKTGCVIWCRSLVPQDYKEGDKVDASSFRLDAKCQPLDYAYTMSYVNANSSFIYNTNTPKTKDQIRLPDGFNDVVVFFTLNSSIPPFLFGKTVTLTLVDGSTVSYTYNLGDTLLPAHEGATGYVTVDSTLHSLVNYSVLSIVKACDILSSSEADSLNYHGASVEADTLVFDPLRWQLIVPTGMATQFPLDQRMFFQGVDFKTQGQKFVNDTTATLLNVVITALATYECDSEQYKTALQNYNILVAEEEKRRKQFSPRDRCNYSSSIVSMDACTGHIAWAFKTEENPIDVWSKGQYPSGGTIPTPWKQGFSTNIHIFRHRRHRRDLYTAYSQGGILYSINANSGCLKSSLHVSVPDIFGSFGTATDGKNFYAVARNSTFGVSFFAPPVHNCQPKFESEQSYLFKFNPFRNCLKWVSPTYSSTFSRPLICNDVVYVPDVKGYLRFYDVCDGRNIGHIVLPWSGFAPPLINDHNLVICGGARMLGDAVIQEVNPACGILVYKIKEKEVKMTKECPSATSTSC